ALEVVLEPAQWLDRNGDVQHRADILGPRPGRVNEVVGVDSLTGAQYRAGDAAPVAYQPGHLAGHELGTQRPGLVAEAQQHAIRIQPAVVRRVHGAAQVRDVHRGESVLELV